MAIDIKARRAYSCGMKLMVLERGDIYFQGVLALAGKYVVVIESGAEIINNRNGLWYISPRKSMAPDISSFPISIIEQSPCRENELARRRKKYIARRETPNLVRAHAHQTTALYRQRLV